VKFLARLNWYTIEFGLIRKPEGIRIYGAGIVSSFGEAKYVVSDPSANFLAFDVDRVLRTGYYIDDFQATYFVIDRFEDLFDLLKRTDFAALYDELQAQPSYTPFEIRPEDVIVRQGTGDYWRSFPATKSRLK
jgi:phenylalanine-4-hydroxylase